MELCLDGLCLNAAEGSIFNMGSNFQPKEITNKEEFLGQRSHLYMSLKKYSLDIDRFGGFNHYAEVQCFSNQEHFAYLAPSYYEKDFPKFYCVDDIYPTVQVRYGKIKGPSCDDLDPNYIPPTERLIPDYGYYVFHKVTSLPEYENVILKDETENINNNSEEEKVESIEVKTETTEEVKVPVVTKPLSITPASTTPKPVVSNSTSLEPYEIRFISPSNGTKAQLEEMLTFKVEVGAKIKKVIVDDISYFYNPTDSPYSGIKSFEVPVYGGRADFATRIEGTLVPITFYLEGVADDQSAYLEAENKLTQSEVSKMFLEIKPFTNQPIEYFALETKSQEVNYINFKDEKSWVPQFIAGFPVHGIIAIPRDEVEYTISDPTVLKIDKDSVGPRYFMGLKNGSTSVIAKYKGMTQEIFYIVEYPPEE